MSARVENLKLAAEGYAAERGHGRGLETSRGNCAASEPLFKRLLRKVFPDQRKQERITVPPLVGYLGTMRATKPYEIGDVSSAGFSLVTNERWETGTEMPITLQRTNLTHETEPDCFTVQATVVRWGEDGVGFSIVLSEEESNAAHGNHLRVKWASKPEMDRFLQRVSGQPDSVSEISGTTHTESVSYIGVGRTALTHSAGD